MALIGVCSGIDTRHQNKRRCSCIGTFPLQEPVRGSLTLEATLVRLVFLKNDNNRQKEPILCQMQMCHAYVAVLSLLKF